MRTHVQMCSQKMTSVLHIYAKRPNHTKKVLTSYIKFCEHLQTKKLREKIFGQFVMSVHCHDMGQYRKLKEHNCTDLVCIALLYKVCIGKEDTKRATPIDS